MFGINGAELLVLVVVALLVVGPERLPSYAEQLGVWVRTLRRFVSTAKDRVASELGEDVGDVDWASLDPRRYDPRRIVREALLEEIGSPADLMAGTAGGRRYVSGRRPAAEPDGDQPPPASAAPAPYDDEAT